MHNLVKLLENLVIFAKVGIGLSRTLKPRQHAVFQQETPLKDGYASIFSRVFFFIGCNTQFRLFYHVHIYLLLMEYQ